MINPTFWNIKRLFALSFKTGDNGPAKHEYEHYMPKVKIKTRQMSINIFTNFVGVSRLFALVYLNVDDNSKRYKAQTYQLPKGIIKTYNVIINVKRYKKIRKLKTVQYEGYTTGCFLNYD